MINDKNLPKSKKELRKYAKELRSSFDMKKVSEKIINNFLNNFVTSSEKPKIALYYPFGNEIDLTILLKNSDFDFYLPKVFCDNNMEFFGYKNGNELIINKYGIKEPKVCENSCYEFDAIIVPALMADKNFNRLGYGGGYYDRFLKKYKNLSYIFIPEKLLVSSLPVEENDIACDFIVTENKFYQNY